MRLRGLLAAAVLLVAACDAASSPGAAEPVPTSTLGPASSTGSTVAALVARAGVETAPVRFPPVGAELPADKPGTLEFVACRWRAPGMFSFDLTWVPEGEVEWPMKLPVGLGFTHGDVGGGQVAEVTLDRPGGFSVAVDVYAADSPWRSSGDPVRGGRAGPAIDMPTTCQAWTHSHDLRVAPTIDPAPRQSAALTGGLEELIADIDPVDTGDPLLPLAYLFAHGGLPDIDRLFLVEGLPIEYAVIETSGPCVTVSVTYPMPKSELVLRQAIRCESGYPGSSGFEAAIPDDVWAVTLSGAEADVVANIGEVVMVPVVGAEPISAEDAEFDANAAIDARVAEGHRGLEVARLEWGGGLVAVMALPGGAGWGTTYSDPIVASPDHFNPGIGGMDCRDFSLVQASDSERGFLLAVTHDVGYRVVVGAGADARSVPLEPVADGLFVGLLDTPSVEVFGFDQVAVADADGNPVPCVQS